MSENNLDKHLQELDIFPVMGEPLNESNSLILDFTADNPDLPRVDLKSTEKFSNYVFSKLNENNKTYGYGGYLEKREIYKRSEHFQKGEPRCFHLGVDVWTDAFHPVYSPLDGIVHSFANNDNYGDYGPTIILAHEVANQTIYSLYGHLSNNSLDNISEGMVVEKGQKFCELGPYPENGDWPPHLHFQVMTDMLGKKGDFPGVCSHSELSQYKQICLEPSPFFG